MERFYLLHSNWCPSHKQVNSDNGRPEELIRRLPAVPEKLMNTVVRLQRHQDVRDKRSARGKPILVVSANQIEDSSMTRQKLR